MKVQLYPRIYFKIIINKCIKKVSHKRSKLEILNFDECSFWKEQIPDLEAKIKYFQQAKIFKQMRLKKLAPEKRSRSAEKQSINHLRSKIWVSKKKLRELKIEGLFKN